jgi:hypothetical protein
MEAQMIERSDAPNAQVEQLQPHPLADRFPPPSEPEYQQLKDDIDVNGQRVPIVTFQGSILDGRSRYRACLELGVEPIVREFDEERESSPLLFVISMNFARRHLTDAERAKLRRSFVADLRAEGLTQSEIGKILGTSQKTVDRDLKRPKDGLERPDAGLISHDDYSEPAGQGTSTKRLRGSRPRAGIILSRRGHKRPATYKPQARPVKARPRTQGGVQPEGVAPRSAPADGEVALSPEGAVATMEKMSSMWAPYVSAANELGTRIDKGELASMKTASAALTTALSQAVQKIQMSFARSHHT